MAIEDIPIEAITAARDAMADEYLSKSLALEQTSLSVCIHKKRIMKRIAIIGRYLSQLDAWIKEVKK